MAFKAFLPLQILFSGLFDLENHSGELPVRIFINLSRKECLNLFGNAVTRKLIKLWLQNLLQVKRRQITSILVEQSELLNYLSFLLLSQQRAYSIKVSSPDICDVQHHTAHHVKYDFFLVLYPYKCVSQCPFKFNLHNMSYLFECFVHSTLLIVLIRMYISWFQSWNAFMQIIHPSK